MIANRKERHRLFTILIINMVILFVFAEANDVWRQIADKAPHTATVCIVEDCMDFDEDENEDYLPEFFSSRQNALPPLRLSLSGQSSSEVMIGKALRIGLVRRHYQRGEETDNRCYTVFHNVSSGVDLFHITFFLCNFPPFQEIKSKNKNDDFV